MFTLAARTSFILFTLCGAAQSLAIYTYAPAAADRPHFAQETDRYCGPAVARMILASREINKDPLPSQDDLRDRIYRSNNGWNGFNSANTRADFVSSDPDGIRGALAHYDPAHTWVSYKKDTVNAANRQLAYNLERYHVPAAAVLYEGGHWVSVYGFKSDVRPTLGGAYTIDGFYINDPAGVAGKHKYMANDADAWRKDFLPIKAEWGKDKGSNVPNGLGGKYCFVADPDPEVDIPSDPAPLPRFVNPLTPAQAVVYATSFLNSTSELRSEYGFSIMGGGFISSLAQSLTAYNDATSIHWALPFMGLDSMGNSIYTGAMVVDAWTGRVKQASWLDSGENGSFDSYLTGLRTEYSGQYIIDNIPAPGGLAALGAGLILASRRRRHAAR